MQKPVRRIHFLGICGTAMGAVAALSGDGLSIGQSDEFFAFIKRFAEEADEARRGGFLVNC